MSRENVEIVRRVADAIARRDSETVLALYDPDLEWDVSRSPFGAVMGQGVYHGHEGLRTWSRGWYEAWETLADEYEDLIDARDCVISAVTNRGRGRASGVEVELTQWAVWTLRAGRIVRVVWFPTQAEAFGAAGVAESRE